MDRKRRVSWKDQTILIIITSWGRGLHAAGGHPEFKIGVGALVYSQTLPAPTQASNHFFYVLTAIGQVEQSGIPCYTFARMHVDRTKYWSPG